jgi:transglutaminase-like putative cysteine protease
MSIIHHPPTLINGYLSEKLNTLFAPDSLVSGPTVPFFPSMPTDIDALTETFPYSDGRFAVYDRMFKMRRKAFPHIKCEQLMYYFYAYGDNAIKNVIEIAQGVQDWLDDGDEAAQDLNDWVKTKIDVDGNVTIGATTIRPTYFHSLKIFQLEETRDIIDFGTARTYAGNKIIIDYEYHKN